MAVVPISPRLRAVGFMRMATTTLRKASRQGEVVLALCMIAIFAGLILPMPSFLLDMFLVMSLSLSVVVVMTTLFIKRPLEMNSFPTILLISTLIRLALNVASTRLILSHGYNGTDAAGYVIQAFGNLVMEGNFIVGNRDFLDSGDCQFCRHYQGFVTNCRGRGAFYFGFGAG